MLALYSLERFFEDETHAGVRKVHVLHDLDAVLELLLAAKAHVDDVAVAHEKLVPVAAAADSFFTTISGTELDFRMAVTSADNRQNLWVIEETGFTNDAQAFRDAMLRPPGGPLEFGLQTGLNIIRQASGNVLDPHQLFRRDAS